MKCRTLDRNNKEDRKTEPTFSRKVFSASLGLGIALSLVWNTGCGGGSSGSGTPPPPANLPPAIAKVFGAASVSLNGKTSLSFNLSNPNTAISLSGIGFTDAFPSGLTVASPNGLAGSCGGGTITAAAGSNSVSLSGASLAAGASCTFAVNVVGTTAGAQNNVTSAVTSTEAGNGSTASAQITVVGPSQQPAEPTDITPINGQVYYVINQLSGLQADLNNNSTTAGANIVQQPRTFTNTSQRWAFTALPGGSSSGGSWQISNILNSLCLDSAAVSGVAYVVQNPCSGNSTQQWILTPVSAGYYTISNTNTGLLIDLYQGSTSAGTLLDQTALNSSGAPTQSQQWLLRPAFFRGIDNALLEKQEVARASTGLTWWKDDGQPLDVLAMLKKHGVNMVRLRPSSAPPYSNPSQTGCSGNACYAESEAQDLDLAKRSKNLGLSVELTLLFDGGSSMSVPPAWADDTLAQLQTDIYAYVKAEIMAYRQAGVMPDLVAIGNEVDTGFLGSIGSPTGTDFSGFASLQIQALQAVDDAAADTSIGPAVPPPLTCIHITPAWNLTQFFTLANQNGIAYDAICQSYYPFYHGPLTDEQAAESNPQNQPVEQDVLVDASNSIGKPTFIIETGEHYENGSESNDPWYSPPSIAEQQQFLLDLQGVQEGLPNNLGMGIEYWNPAGVNIPNLSGGFINGDNQADAIYSWNGLTLFNNADTSGTTNVNDPTYSELLPSIDALGGNLDSTLTYKFVNRSSGDILSVYLGSNTSGAILNAEANSGSPSISQQWHITSNLDGYFQIASVNPGAGNTTNALDDSGASTISGTAIVQSLANSSTEQEWMIVSVGNGYFNFINHLSGLALDTGGGSGALAGFVVQDPQSSSTQTQQWQIVAVH
ncbi:MAG: RICIN domain-containing protein [Candidatus Sulfotelmatobacter sp.]